MMMLCVGCGQQAPASDNADAARETASQTEVSVEETAGNEAADQTSDTDEASAPDTQEVTAGPSDNDDNGAGDVEADEADQNMQDEDASSQYLDDGGSDMNARDIFPDFLMGKTDAKVAQDFLSDSDFSEEGLQPGKSYSVPQLREMIEKDEALKGTEPVISYAPLLLGDDTLYALNLYYDTSFEAWTYLYILSDKSGGLEIMFSICGWSRNRVSVNENGIVFLDGSGGAGSHITKIFAPDKDHTYKTVSDAEHNYPGWAFYDGESASDTVNSVINEAAEGNTKAGDVEYTREIINGRKYYYFLGGVERLTQDTVDYIDNIAAAHNFKFDGKAAADEAREAFEKELGVEEFCKNTAEPHWKSIN